MLSLSLIFFGFALISEYFVQALNTIDYFPAYINIGTIITCKIRFCQICDSGICSKCFDGYKLVGNLCLSCPFLCDNCEQKSIPLYCSDGMYYVLDENQTDLVACPFNCKNCSRKACLDCDVGSLIVISNDKSSSRICDSCQTMNCSKCSIMNQSAIVDLSDYPKLDYNTFSDYFNNQTWSQVCTKCNDDSYLDNLNSCSLCSLEIAGCTQCSLNNGNIVCSQCEPGMILDDSNTTCFCPIDNCEICSTLSLCDFCTDGYSLSKNQSNCLLCPSNCEVCQEDLSNNTVNCLICNDNYFLDIVNKSCEENESLYENQTDCLKFLNYNDVFYCQICDLSDTYKIPTNKGYCMSCPEGCVKCNEYLETPNENVIINVNLTELIKNNPYEFIWATQNDISFGLICENCLEGYSLIQQMFCFNAGSYVGCDICDSWDFNLNCEKCSKCIEQLDNSKLQNASYINNIDYKNPYYGKKIYALLKDLYNLTEYPVKNLETNAYLNTIYNNLVNISQVDFPQNDIKRCVACHIGTHECEISDTYTDNQFSDLLFSAFELLPYLTNDTGDCNYGFTKIQKNSVYRCKFCPHGWTDCYNYKHFDILVGNNMSQNTDDGFIRINTIQDLSELFVALSNNEFSIIMNEFYVQEIKISIYFETGITIDLTSPTSTWRTVFSAPFLKNIISLEKYIIELKPKNYDLGNRDDVVNVILDTSFYLTGFTQINFYNINFTIENIFSIHRNLGGVTIDIFSLAPGFLAEASHIELVNCSFYPNTTSSLFISSNLFVQFKSDTINLSNITLSFTRNPFVQNAYNYPLQGFFVLQFTDLLKMENISIINCSLDNYNIFTIIGGTQVIINNMKVSKITFLNSAFISNKLTAKFDITNFSISESHFEKFTLLSNCDSSSVVSDCLSTSLSITNFSITSSSFFNSNNYNSQALFSSACVNLEGIDIENSEFFSTTLSNTGSFDCDDQANYTRIHILNNNFLFDTYSFSFITGLAVVEDTQTCGISDIILINNSFDENSIATNFYLVQVSYLHSIDINNIFISNSPVFSGIIIDTISFISIINLTVKNYELSNVYSQNAIMISPLPNSLILQHIYLENLFNAASGIIFLDSSVNDYNVSRVANISEVYSDTIYLEVEEIQIASVLVITSDDKIQFEISNCQFINSYANDESLYQISTSSITIDSLVSYLLMRNSNFTNNTSTGTKNILYLALNNFDIEDCHFDVANIFYPGKTNSPGSLYSDLSWIKTSGSVGYFILLEKSNINNSKFSNIFGYNGGVFYINNIKSQELNILNSVFEYIQAMSQGGIIYSNFYETSIVFSINIKFCLFNSIESQYDGGVLYIVGLKNNILSTFNNSIISNLNSSVSSFLYGENIILVIFNCSVKNNYKGKVFNYALLTNLSQDTFAGDSFIFLINSELRMNFSNFTELYSYTFTTSIFQMNQGKILINFCVFSQIFFTKSCFYLSNIEANFKYSLFFNCSTPKNFLESLPNLPFIYHTLGTNLTINGSKVQLIICNFCITGGNFLYSSVSLFIDNSIFSQNTGIKSSGGVLYIENPQNTTMIVYINNSIFANNFGFGDGGCIFLSNAKSFIYNMRFQGCTSSHNGGAINFFGYITHPENNLKIYNSKFINNSAEVGGAIYYQSLQIEIDMESCIFTENFAQIYGDKYFSYPRSLLIMQSNVTNNLNFENELLIINNFMSGDFFPNISIEILDEEGNPLKYIENSSNPYLSIQIIGLDNTIYSINNKKEITNISMENDDSGSFGKFVISNLKLIAKPNSQIYLIITSDSIFTLTKNTTDIVLKQNQYQLNITVNLRLCKHGELYLNMSGVCSPCLTKEEYSFDIQDSHCKKCLTGLDCLDPGAPTILPGYWRDDIYSEDIIQCENFPESCIGGIESKDQICNEGYIGARCESCDLTLKYWNYSYAKSGLYQCNKCKNSILNYVFFVFMSALNFALMGLALKGTYNIIRSTLQLRVIKAFSVYSLLPIKTQNESSIYIKIYLSYFQVIQVLSNMKLKGASFFDILTMTTGNPIMYVSNATDCFFLQQTNTNIPYIYAKLIIILMIPIFYFVSFSIGYLLYVKNKVMQRKYHMLYSVCLFSLFYFQPAIIRYTINILTCVKISNTSYIKLDLAFYCENDDYYFYSMILALPSLILWGFLIPAILLWRLYVNRDELKEIKIKLRYGYLYEEYRIFFWEFIRMYEKVLIIIFLEFYETEIVFKTLLVLIVIAAYFVLVDKFRPYKMKNQNKIDKMTTVICFISIFSGLLIYTYPVIYVQVIGWGLLIILNVGYNIFILKLIFVTLSDFFQFFFNFIPFLRKLTQGKKKIVNEKIMEKWKTVRRLTARYLREKHRRKLIQNSANAHKSYFRLDLNDYDPNCVGIKRLKMTQIIPNSANSINRFLDDERSFISSPPEKKKSNHLMDFINEALNNLRFDESK